jgi:hypothetical protein
MSERPPDSARGIWFPHGMHQASGSTSIRLDHGAFLAEGPEQLPFPRALGGWGPIFFRAPPPHPPRLGPSRSSCNLNNERMSPLPPTKDEKQKRQYLYGSTEGESAASSEAPGPRLLRRYRSCRGEMSVSALRTSRFHDIQTPPAGCRYKPGPARARSTS